MKLDHLNIEPTNKCQLNCKWCGDNKTRPTGNIKLRDVKEILEQAKEINPNCEIRFFLSGEPLLHPLIDQLCVMAKTMGFPGILIHTNGVALNQELSKRLVNSGLTHISFSVDGRNREEYEKIRGPHLSDVLWNIYQFGVVNARKVHTTIQCIIPYPSPLKIPKHIEHFKNYNIVNDIFVRWPHNWDVDGSVKESQPEKFPIPCGFLEDSLPLYWNGDCAVCCADLNGRYILGNVFKDGLKELIKRRDKLAEKQKRGESIPVCDGCERYETMPKR